MKKRNSSIKSKRQLASAMLIASAALLTYYTVVLIKDLHANQDQLDVELVPLGLAFESFLILISAILLGASALLFVYAAKPIANTFLRAIFVITFLLTIGLFGAPGTAKLLLIPTITLLYWNFKSQDD